jgi:septum formation protein
MRTLVLASSSPRRSELLQAMGFKFQTLSVEISEIFKENLNLEDGLLDVARRKAEAVVRSGKLLNIKDFLVLSGDTIVMLEGEVLGKPANRDIAIEYLSKLSEKTHCVMTGICLWDGLTGEVLVNLDRSFVTFKKLSREQIEKYVDTGDPMDKAGAYGIQSLDRGFIEKIEGSIENVMGLPVQLLSQIFEKKGWEIAKR